ncbi:MAG: RES family NAD+ phosphorylase [Cyanobium sp.]
MYRASRKPRPAFNPLDASASMARDGWRFNDKRSAILYTAEVQSLAMLEVVSRPGWSTMAELAIAAIKVPDGSVVSLIDLGLLLPTNWNVRPAGPNARSIGGEFLKAVDQAAAGGRQICGLRVPSVISTTDCNVLLDPRQQQKYKVVDWARIPFRAPRIIGV